MPRIAPFMKIFSRPVISPWNPVPTSSSEPMRPCARIVPVVGPVTRLRSLRRVDLPAPFLPMMPTTSPCSTLKSMSLNAQTYSEDPLVERSFVSPILRYGSSWPRTLVIQKRRMSWLRVLVETNPSLYCFETCSNSIAILFPICIFIFQLVFYLYCTCIIFRVNQKRRNPQLRAVT